MLQIHFANRFETLSALLVQRLGEAKGSPFDTQPVIIPSAAVRRQITLDLARAQGICANQPFTYLARWLREQGTRVLPGQADGPDFDPSHLVWRVLDALHDCSWTDSHPRLAAYLASADAVMVFDLARRIAGHFDQYSSYRPEWLALWAQGRLAEMGATDANAQADHRWQSELWRRLLAVAGSDPGAESVNVLRALQAPTPASLWPAAVHVFCLPDLPPLHLKMLLAASRHCAIELYALNPCREYWFEVVGERRLASLASRGQAQHHESGHRLLAAWGQQTQSQLKLLVAASDEQAEFHEHYAEPGAASLLARLQASMLDLSDLAPGSVQLDDADRSIELHVCHSLTREIEVLQDRLLSLWAGIGPRASPMADDAQPASVAPGDVLVVVPDLEAAAPLIDAVFGTAPPERFIPYTLTGRGRSSENPAARALLDLLSLLGSRFAISDVLGLAQQASVARRFGLDDDALQQLADWLRSAGVHWALDAEHRGSLGVPASARHSLADGVDKLYLGYALPDRADAPLWGRLPAGPVQGSQALTLGALWRFVDGLSSLRQRSAQPLSPEAWTQLLNGALQDFVQADPAAPEDLREVQAAVLTLGRQWRASGLTQALPREVVLAALQQALDDPARGGVPTGRVTFSSLASLRNLPFDHVCVLGLNDADFPSRQQPSEFDLLALHTREGDRQRRVDERNLFLDLVLAARQGLYLSCVGRSVRDNAPLPPSVLVSELIEYLAPVIASDPADADSLARARSRLRVDHPLQPFAQAAFRIDSDARLRSFHAGYAQALRAALAAPVVAAPQPAHTQSDDGDSEHEADGGGPGDNEGDNEDEAVAAPAAPFFATALPAPAVQGLDLPLLRLCEFFRNPCAYLLRRRLGLQMWRDEDEPGDDEPFVADTQARNALASRLMPQLLAGASTESLRELALAGLEVPAGTFGRLSLEQDIDQMQAFARALRPALADPCLPPAAFSVDVEVDAQTWRVHAGMADLRASGLVRHRYGNIRAGDRLDAWLHHLLLCAAAPAAAATVTTLITSEAALTWKPRADAQQQLQVLLALYRRGLSEPLPFFPKSSLAFINKDKGESWSSARKSWEVTTHSRFGESGHPAYQLALRGLPDPVLTGSHDFAACAHAVYDPLLEALR